MACPPVYNSRAEPSTMTSPPGTSTANFPLHVALAMALPCSHTLHGSLLPTLALHSCPSSNSPSTPHTPGALRITIPQTYPRPSWGPNCHRFPSP